MFLRYHQTHLINSDEYFIYSASHQAASTDMIHTLTNPKLCLVYSGNRAWSDCTADCALVVRVGIVLVYIMRFVIVIIQCLLAIEHPDWSTVHTTTLLD